MREEREHKVGRQREERREREGKGVKGRQSRLWLGAPLGSLGVGKNGIQVFLLLFLALSLAPS